MKKILLYTTVLLAWTALCSTVTPYYSTNPPVIDGKLDAPCWSQDWIEYEFLKPSKIGRVVVYPAENSLNDYRIEIERNGRFVTVADIKDAQGEAQTHTFPPPRRPNACVCLSPPTEDRTPGCLKSKFTKNNPIKELE